MTNLKTPQMTMLHRNNTKQRKRVNKSVCRTISEESWTELKKKKAAKRTKIPQESKSGKITQAL